VSNDGFPGRLKRADLALAPTGDVDVVFTPGESPDDREAKEKLLAEARRRKREVVEVRINLGPAPA
jgi:hypothetical protein